MLDLRHYPHLTRIVIGNDCFGSVSHLYICDLPVLESIEVGENSFTSAKDGCPYSYNKYFYAYIQWLPKLKSLKIGRYSFSDAYDVNLSDLPSLETIQFGDLNQESCNFHFGIDQGFVSRSRWIV